MDNMALERLSENYALNLYLSDYVSNYDEIMEAFFENECPEDVIIWEYFEDMNLRELAFNIEVLRNNFLEFAERIKNENL